MRTGFLVIAAALGACAAEQGTQVVPGRDAGARDTGSRDVATDRGAPSDAIAPVDVPATVDAGEGRDAPPAMDAPATPDVPVAMDVSSDRGAPVDLPAPLDLPPADVGFDAGAVSLGDAWSAERDAGDPTPRDVDRVISPAPSDSASRLGGGDEPWRAPSIVYPEEGTILPPNLTGFEVHFRPGAGNDLFEVSLRGDRGALRVFTRCNAVADGCALSLDEAAYNELARVAQPSGDVTLTVRGTSASGGGVGRSVTRSIGVTNFDVRGGLYYWAAASGTINRFEFGRAGARAEPYLRGDPINCLGCHVLSRDGSRVMVGRFIPGPAATRIYDVPTRASLSADYGANFGTFSPDVRWLLTSNGSTLALRNPVNGAEVPGLPGPTAGTHPDWSRDGRRVVFARPRTSIPFLGTPGHDGPADLLTMAWSGTAFAAPTVLLAASGARNNSYYPSFSPDDAWVLFNRATGNSNNNIDAQLWVMPSTGGAPTRLANADLAEGMGNSWPKWAPFVQRYQGEPLMWFTFSSRRDYGLRLRQQSREAGSRTAQLWMAAFRPSRAASGDASAPAFWLPFQSMSEGNHIAQWAEAVQRMGCTSDADCNLQERCLPVEFSVAATRYGCVSR
ncbi:MAG: hypothetical protein R3A52_19615 [Polyangiales bacterium]